MKVSYLQKENLGSILGVIFIISLANSLLFFIDVNPSEFMLWTILLSLLAYMLVTQYQICYYAKKSATLSKKKKRKFI